MCEDKRIREYVDDYIKYFPNKWRWSLKQDSEQSDLFLRTRARQSKNIYENSDLLPDFYSIERDADQFELSHVEWTDFFGLVWEGKKGVFAYVGAPDYEGSLYYYDAEGNSCDESGFSICYEYDAYNNQPPADIYTKVVWRGTAHWIDTADACDIKYKYIVNNHLFKDTYVELIYDNGDTVRVLNDYHALINGLRRQGKKDLIEVLLKSMNEHFMKLRDSDREEVREYYPGKTAEEMFLEDKNDQWADASSVQNTKR